MNTLNINYIPFLHDNIIHYKTSKINIVPVNEKWFKNDGEWKNWITEKSNTFYISFIILENPHHFRKILKLAFEQNKDKIIYPLRLFAIAETENGNKLLEKIFTCHYYPWHSIELLCEAQLKALLRL